MLISIEPIVLREGRYFTKRQAAERCGVAVETVQYWVTYLGLPVISIGTRGYLIAQADLETFTPPRGARRTGTGRRYAARRLRYPTAVEGLALPEGRYFTKRQTSQLRGVTVEAVERWIRCGYLSAVRAGGIGWLIEEQTLAAFTPPPLGPRPMDSPLPPPPEIERIRYHRNMELLRAREQQRMAQLREGQAQNPDV